MPAGMGGRFRVGVDVSVGQLTAGLLDLHHAGEPHAYPLLISSGNLLLAGGNRLFRTGRHIRFPEQTPVTNLYLSMLDAMGVATEKLGDSQGRLNYLSDLT